MALKVVFSKDQNSVTVGGLFQWDYGRVLEIESPDIGSEIVEIHFACPNMSEAIVRPCSFSNGVGTVTIPDHCLEQDATITAWIYKIIDTQGYTIKTIILPISKRTRPSIAREIPQEFKDKYTELITEINEAVDNLESGNITVALANEAKQAIFASGAGNASTANYATSSGAASTAEKASHPASGDYFITNKNFCGSRYAEKTGDIDAGVYMIHDGDSSIIMDTLGTTEVSYSSVYYREYLGVVYPHRIAAGIQGTVLYREYFTNSAWQPWSTEDELSEPLCLRAIDLYPQG